MTTPNEKLTDIWITVTRRRAFNSHTFEAPLTINVQVSDLEKLSGVQDHPVNTTAHYYLHATPVKGQRDRFLISLHRTAQEGEYKGKDYPDNISRIFTQAGAKQYIKTWENDRLANNWRLESASRGRKVTKIAMTEDGSPSFVIPAEEKAMKRSMAKTLRGL